MKPRSLVPDLASLAVFAAEFLKAHPQGAVVGLSGELGAGKTTFVRAVVQVIAERGGVAVPRVTSPSYVIHQHYELTPPIDHLDLYRMDRLNGAALVELGYQEILIRRQRDAGLVFVEWPENAADAGLLSMTCHIMIQVEGSARTFDYRRLR